MYYLGDLSLPAPKVRIQYNWMCSSCRTVSTSKKCSLCPGSSSVVYLDRRPLLLSLEAKDMIHDLLQEATDRVVAAEIDEQIQITCEYMPFLAKLIDDSETALTRQSEGDAGYRSTDLSIAELRTLFSGMRLP